MACEHFAASRDLVFRPFRAWLFRSLESQCVALD